jgi:HK97 family phage prohead protease
MGTLKPRRPVNKEYLSLELESFQLGSDLGEEESGRFRGIGVRFDSPIETFPNRTKFRPGAFANTLKQRADRIKILMQHNQSKIFIGVPTMLAESKDGLVVEASLNKTVEGQNAAAAFRHLGQIDKLDAAELSIGFDALNFVMEEDDDTKEMFRVITEARLWEISVVNIGADPHTAVTEAASLDDDDLKLDPLLSDMQALDEHLAALELAGAASDEALEGRTFSRATLRRIKDAINALQSLISKADPQGDGDDDNASKDKKKQNQARLSSAFDAEVMAMELELAEADSLFSNTEETLGQNHT